MHFYAFVCKDLHPYSVVDNEGFRQLLIECEQHYTIPTCKFVTETAVPQLNTDVKQKSLFTDVKQKSLKQSPLQAELPLHVMLGCREQPSHT